VLLTLALLASACSDSSAPDGDAAALPVLETSTTSTTTATTTTSSTTTTTTLAPPQPLVLDDTGVAVNGQTHGAVIADSGWVLPVLGGVGDGWRVWTPCANEADITEGRYVESVDVVLDPGHGGPSEPGATGHGGVHEAELDLEIAKRIAVALEAAGYSVVLTRSSDVRLPIVTRAEIARSLSPRAFISIHLNAGIDAPSPGPGTEMYFQLADPESRRLSGLLYEETTAALSTHDIAWVSMSDAGAMARPNRAGTDYYGVLRRPGPVTSVLAEIAYISNPGEAELLSTRKAQDEVAAAMARAFDRWVHTTDPGSGYTDNPIFRGYGPSGAGFTEGCVDPSLP